MLFIRLSKWFELFCTGDHLRTWQFKRAKQCRCHQQRVPFLISRVQKKYTSHYSSFQVDDINAVRSVLVTVLSRQEIGNAARKQERSCGGNVGNCHQRKIKHDLHSAGSLCMKYSENGETCEARTRKTYA
jgi:hypothetical protein